MRGKDWGKCESILHMLDSLDELASSMDDKDVREVIHKAIQMAIDDVTEVFVDKHRDYTIWRLDE